jgi:hypothetical protein
VGGIVLCGWIAYRRIFTPLRVTITDDDLAIFVERRFPDLDDRLISAIQLSREPATELVTALVNDADQAASRIDFHRVILWRPVGRIALGALLVGAFLAAGAWFFPVYAKTWLQRIAGGSAKWPQRTHLTVVDFKDGRRVVARGDDLAIAVEYAGREPSKVILEYKFQTGEKGRERMSPLAGKRFQFTFTRVIGSFECVIEGGDDVTAVHYVDTVTPPSIDTMRFYHEYPPYLRKTNTPLDRPETSGNVTVPLGTKVRFEALTNEDLRSASMARGKEQATDLTLENPRLFGCSFTVSDVASEVTLHLTAANGLVNRDPIRYTIKGIEDRPPDIVVRDPLGDEFVTDLCERPLEIEVGDDHGIARIALEVRVISQQPEKSREWAHREFTRKQNSRDYGETMIKSDHTLDIAEMGLATGDHVELRFRAEDYKDMGGRNVRLSKVYKFSIVSVGTLEKELQDSIEKIKILLKNQKIRQETAWNRTGRFINTYGRVDQLSLEQQGEVRQAGLEQNDLTAKLDGARKDIRQIQRRGVYNKIYNESAAQKLQGAIDELDPLVGDTARDGLSRVAAARLDQSARLKNGADRASSFRDAQNLQNAVAAAIQRALEFLDKWSSYQEVIRMVREIKDHQEALNRNIKQSGGGK